MKTSGFLTSQEYLKHDTGMGHPETPGRLEAIWNKLDKSALSGEIIRLEPYSAELAWIETTHSKSYIEHVREICSSGTGFLDSLDTAVCGESYEIALLAAGGAIKAVDSVMEGEELKRVFCAVRPPGHHAIHGMAMGFCLFNNVAIAARYAQKKHGIGRILILDWDVHHGNGTQDTFYGDSTVLYVSLHQYPHYPGTGNSNETGAGEGRGFTLNCPMDAYSSDEDYLAAFEKKIMPAAKKFAPEFILISAGFDAHRNDPLSQIQLTTGAFGKMTDYVMELATEHAQGRVVSLLEGGYNLQALSESVLVHLEHMK